MEFIDTHCHIHSANYDINGNDPTLERWLAAGKPEPDDMITEAVALGVTKLLCVGTDLEDSIRAVTFAQSRPGVYATIGLHPHEAKRYAGQAAELEQFTSLISMNKVVAVGECGLDYYYQHSEPPEQRIILEYQLGVAMEYKLPVIFHVRDAFDDFWAIFDNFKGIKGVIHSFSSDSRVLDKALERDLYIGLNGIMTFTKDQDQLQAAKMVPLQKLLLETDSPYLTPKPLRGTVNKPKYVVKVAEFLSELRGETLDTLSTTTTANANQLFCL